jgi:Xaa-Pro aminopeptidase
MANAEDEVRKARQAAEAAAAAQKSAQKAADDAAKAARQAEQAMLEARARDKKKPNTTTSGTGPRKDTDDD